MSALGESTTGLWASGKVILETLLAAVQTRVELLACEVQEEKCRLVEALLCAAAVAAFGMMTLTMVTFTLVVLFWENGRLPVLIGLSLAYLCGTAFAFSALRRRLRKRTAFAGTLGELETDRSCLKPEN